MIKAYINFWKLALKSEGRSSRSDYWWAFLVNSIIRAVIIFIDFIIIFGEFAKRITSDTTPADVQQITQEVLTHLPSSAMAVQIIGTVFSLLIMIPVTTLTARRLRDAGYSPALAYPLPAIYLAIAVQQFVFIPILSNIMIIANVYAIVLLVLCAKKTSDPALERKI
ncbi:MAG: DUF805 domain-containing protein [Streptococcaceae bacterium]|nr:DUF805 domain-containing protein [Streptococcaceae bacterium]